MTTKAQEPGPGTTLTRAPASVVPVARRVAPRPRHAARGSPTGTGLSGAALGWSEGQLGGECLLPGGRGLSKPEIIRCLKRYVARELYNALQPANPPEELAEAA